MRKNFKLKTAISNQSGLTLTEILIVIALLGGIMTVIVTNLTDRWNEGRIETARIQMNSLSQALIDFYRHCNRYPTSDQGLDALIQKPSGLECPKYRPNGYLKDSPRDPWDSPYVYELSGRNSYTIKSLGADGTMGGEGYDADILYEK